MKVWTADGVSESTDHYCVALSAKLTREQVDEKLKERFGDEYEYISWEIRKQEVIR